ncbi:MAG: hypothetical protein R2744_02930 [Bacteroidales bacterium]
MSFLQAITHIPDQEDRVNSYNGRHKYWSGRKTFVDWIKEVMLEQEGNISPGDLDLFTVTDGTGRLLM